MVCVKCGESVNKGIKFCTKCGSEMIDNAPGKGFLKVTGILFLVFSAFGLLGVLGSVVVTAEQSGIVYKSFALAIILGIVGCALSGVLGVMGIKYSRNIAKAELLKRFVIALFVFCLVGNIISCLNIKVSPNSPWIGLFSGIPGWALYICFFIGAHKNLKTKGGQ